MGEDRCQSRLFHAGKPYPRTCQECGLGSCKFPTIRKESELTDERPKWPHKVPEETARWLLNNTVTTITHHWEFTGPDTSRDWLVLHGEKSKEAFATCFFDLYPYEVSFRPDHAGLVQVAPNVRETIRKIDAWEKAHARERREYERLKRKFEGAAG